MPQQQLTVNDSWSGLAIRSARVRVQATVRFARQIVSPAMTQYNCVMILLLTANKIVERIGNPLFLLDNRSYADSPSQTGLAA